MTKSGPASGGAGGSSSSQAVGGFTLSGPSPGSGGTISVGGAAGVGGAGAECDVIVTPIFDQVPADTIFVVANPASMPQEINALEANIHTNFAQIIATAGVDHRVIMVSQHGTQFNHMCIPPPLSGTTNCSGPPVFVPGQFYHYSVYNGAHDSVCNMLSTLDGSTPDTFNLAPNGWESWLRSAALKFFIALTNDGINCSFNNVQYNDQDSSSIGQQVAVDLDSQLLALSTQFGTGSNRKYQFYGLLGLQPNGQNLYYDDLDPVVTGTCFGGVGPGTGYQWLSKGTGAKRFQQCDRNNYSAFFQTIAADIIDATTGMCSFTLPPPPMGELYDYNALTIIYTPGGNGMPQAFVKVDSPQLCMPGAFYVEQADHLVLCPQACQVVEADPMPQLEPTFSCFSDG